MSFFEWAQAGFKLHGNPVVPIRSPRLRDVERELFSAEDVSRIVAVQPSCATAWRSSCSSSWAFAKVSSPRSATATSTSAAGAYASTARAARSGIEPGKFPSTIT
jgi:hypothetical protein